MANFDDLGEGSREAMQFVYNRDNRIEGNALVDTCRGRGFLVNGYVYLSGFQRLATNIVERNYIHDRADNLQNNMVFYSDSDQDRCEYVGNMVSAVQVGDSPAPFPLYVTLAQWPESEPATPAGQILLRANVTRASTFDVHFEGLNLLTEGNVVDGVGAAGARVDIYRQMYLTLCPGAWSPGSPWPGAEAMRAELWAILASLQTIPPTCGLIFSDGFESASTAAWSFSAREPLHPGG